jgi:hypothetical protein
MTRKIAGASTVSAEPLPDGCYLVELERGYHTPGRKPSLTLRMRVLEPVHFAGSTIAGRLYCTPGAMWKLAWFLGDFQYDAELLQRKELEVSRLISLRGVVRIARRAFNGRRLTSFEAFAPAESWTARDGQIA